MKSEKNTKHRQIVLNPELLWMSLVLCMNEKIPILMSSPSAMQMQVQHWEGEFKVSPEDTSWTIVVI